MTGGQYSVVRMLFGGWLLLRFAGPLAAETTTAIRLLLGFGVIASLCLAAGARARLAAIAAFGVWAATAPAPHAGAVVGGVLLLWHACVPPGPYGAWDTRGATDPGSRWRLPTPLSAAAWVALAVAWAYLGWTTLPGAAGVLALLALPLLPVRPLRAWVWGAMLGVQAVRLSTGSPDAAAVLLLQLATFDPAWVPAVRDAAPARVFYDGACGLCHRTVRFLLSEDRDGAAFRFAALGGDAFAAAVPPAARAALPDSIVVQLADGTLLVRSRAVLALGRRLGGLWRLLAAAVDLVPTTLLDAAYDGVAAVRGRVFARPDAACPLLPPHLRVRFD